MPPPSDTPQSAARSDPTASMTARTSSMRCSSVGMALTRSESPVPRLSKRMSRANEAMRSICGPMNGISQATSTWETNPGTITMSSGPSPTTWYAMWSPSAFSA